MEKLEPRNNTEKRGFTWVFTWLTPDLNCEVVPCGFGQAQALLGKRNSLQTGPQISLEYHVYVLKPVKGVNLLSFKAMAMIFIHLVSICLPPPTARDQDRNNWRESTLGTRKGAPCLLKMWLRLSWDNVIVADSDSQQEQWGCDLLRRSNWDEALGPVVQVPFQ